MPDLTLTEVTQYEAVPGSGTESRLVAERYYLRLSAGEEVLNDAGQKVVVHHPAILIQQGVCFGEGGDPIPEDELPDWFWREIQKCTPDALMAVGWQGKPGDPEAPDAFAEPTRPSARRRRR